MHSPFRLFRLHRLLRLALPSARQVRLAAYATFVCGALTMLATRSVRADMGEVGLSLGHQLAKLEDLTEGASLVRVNGAAIHWASARSPQPVSEVLDRFERHCRESPSTLGAALQDIPAALEGRMPVAKGDPARSAIVREDAGDRGMVACFVGADGEGEPLPRLRASLESFARTGDLSALGRFRYVFAERSERGTRVVTLWTDGPLVVGSMFPASGDAPGTDPTFTPRPPESRRTLSASVEGFPAAVRIYETSRRPEEVLATTEVALRTRGFTRVEGLEGAGGAAAYVRRDGAEVVVSVSRQGGAEGRTAVGIVETQIRTAKIAVEER